MRRAAIKRGGERREKEEGICFPLCTFLPNSPPPPNPSPFCACHIPRFSLPPSRDYPLSLSPPGRAGETLGTRSTWLSVLKLFPEGRGRQGAMPSKPDLSRFLMVKLYDLSKTQDAVNHTLRLFSHTYLFRQNKEVPSLPGSNKTWPLKVLCYNFPTKTPIAFIWEFASHHHWKPLYAKVCFD